VALPMSPVLDQGQVREVADAVATFAGS
jgi:hypothetical protein